MDGLLELSVHVLWAATLEYFKAKENLRKVAFKRLKSRESIV